MSSPRFRPPRWPGPVGPPISARKAKKPLAGTPALQALIAASVDVTLHEYDHDPRAESYGLEAAAALGLDPAVVFKTLMASVDGHLVVAVVPVAGRLDLKALARAVGGSKAVMAEVGRAERATGYIAGGISPVGQKRSHPTVVDRCALAHPVIYVSGGRRGLDIGLPPADLVAVTRALTAPISRL